MLASPRVLYQGVPHPAVDMRASAAAAAQHSADQAMLSQSRGTAGAPPSRPNPNPKATPNAASKTDLHFLFGSIVRHFT